MTEIPLQIPSGPCLPVAAPVSREFVRELSQYFLRDSKFRSEPALVALGYWFRDTAVERWLATTFPTNRSFVPRGTVFHIPPGNVETNYLYIWLLSLLVGNRNIVRLPSRESNLVDGIATFLEALLAEERYATLGSMNRFARYQHEARITAFYSASCDLRVVSGSDATIQTLRQVPLQANAVELNLSAKSSFVVLNVATILDAADEQLTEWARDLWSDLSSFDQLACNSPRGVWWLGASQQDIQVARERFWSAFDGVVATVESPWRTAGVVQRESFLDTIGLSGFRAKLASTHNTPVQRVWIEPVDTRAPWFDEWFAGNGILFETAIVDLSALSPHLSRRHQTVSSLGVNTEQWRAFLLEKPAVGIDRIVPMGQSLSFDAVWDGFDIGRILTREITISKGLVD